MRRIKPPSPAMVVAMVALFIALGGAGYAAVSIPRNSVGTSQLRNFAVTPVKIQNNAIKTNKLRNDAVTFKETFTLSFNKISVEYKSRDAKRGAWTRGFATRNFEITLT